jgi:hypothetical protein
LRIIALLFVTVGLSAPARTQPAVEDFYTTSSRACWRAISAATLRAIPIS